VSLRFGFCVHVAHCAVSIAYGPRWHASAQVNGRITFVTEQTRRPGARRPPPATKADSTLRSVTIKVHILLI